MTARPDIVLIVTDQERAAPPYEDDAMRSWRHEHLPERRWFSDHGVSFQRHYTGATACVPSRPTLLTGQYPDVHGVTQTNGLGKTGRRDEQSRERRGCGQTHNREEGRRPPGRAHNRPIPGLGSGS